MSSETNRFNKMKLRGISRTVKSGISLTSLCAGRLRAARPDVVTVGLLKSCSEVTYPLLESWSSCEHLKIFRIILHLRQDIGFFELFRKSCEKLGNCSWCFLIVLASGTK